MKNLHWFSFSYIGHQPNTSYITSHACTYTGYDDKLISIPRIKDNKINAGLTSDATLLSVSYLGYMTREMFKTGLYSEEGEKLDD